MKRKPKQDGSGQGKRKNKGRGGCEELELFGRGRLFEHADYKIF